MLLVSVMNQVTRYMVQVETGDTDDFEPITDVYIILYGELGDSGLRYLSKSKEGGQLFELLKVSRLVTNGLNTVFCCGYWLLLAFFNAFLKTAFNICCCK